MGENISFICLWNLRVNVVFLVVFFRQTKPLTFADCIGKELPVGWEEAFDPAVGAYYVDHNTSEFTACRYCWLTVQLINMYLPGRLQRALSWRTRAPSGSGSRSPCCGTTWPWSTTPSAPRRRSTRWRSRGCSWRSRSTGSSTTRGGTSPHHRPAVSNSGLWSIIFLIGHHIFFLLLCSKLTIVLLQQVRPWHPKSRNRHS